VGKPLCIDLYCGLGGWSESFLAEGWECIGFDIERHDYGSGGYPGQLVLQDVCTIHGAQLVDADCLVASSPCQEFSYRAMPWKRAKALGPPVLGINLFWQAFRIQHELYEACGRWVPLVAENVKGAQPWVGSARWHYGSFYLWGDVPALMPSAKAIKHAAVFPHGRFTSVDGQKWGDCNGKRFDERPKGNVAAHREGTKHGGDWFSGYGGGFGWDHSQMRQHSSKSPARKAASAQIAKIPPPLAQWIARTYKP
jgi:C-5 cytosine-specific DNA methylase